MPAYRYTPDYVRRLNVANVGDRALIERSLRDRGDPRLAYRSQPRAVTVVPVERLREGRPITARDLARPEHFDGGGGLPAVSRTPAIDWPAPLPGARQRYENPRPDAEKPRPQRDTRGARPAEAVRIVPDAPRGWPEGSGRREGDRPPIIEAPAMQRKPDVEHPLPRALRADPPGAEYRRESRGSDPREAWPPPRELQPPAPLMPPLEIIPQPPEGRSGRPEDGRQHGRGNERGPR